MNKKKKKNVCSFALDEVIFSAGFFFGKCHGKIAR